MKIQGNYIIHNHILFPEKDIQISDSPDFFVVYEVFRVEQNTPLFLMDHLTRLFNSLQKAVERVSFSKNEITHDIQQLIKRESIPNGNIRISCIATKKEVVDCYIYYIPASYPTKEMYSQGVSTTLLYAERENPNLKIDNTQTRKTAIQKLKESGHFEALLVNHNNHITEGSRSNVFFIQKNCIYTAAEHFILPGIMRSKVIECILSENIELKFEGIQPDQLNTMDAAFITGTSPRILPISNVDSIMFDTNTPLLRRLMQKIEEKIMDSL
ncbi:aminotransferase class IV [Plebeiibacterium marinum]|uniref:branched-chain-amino-acid transaminase n=1 Tax=Plebeiibacterium marinum TaxID=2992111 RepID=A0AAE3MC39_9BACT|nr:aminotransferase class IV [Plebeiobacterium marinum]MCW3804824.1 aminotransferase class IV [Plebeiobacterium marinum]